MILRKQCLSDTVGRTHIGFRDCGSMRRAQQVQTGWGYGARKEKCTGATIINQVAISNQSLIAL